MTALVTNQTPFEVFFADNVTADPGAPALLEDKLPDWMRGRKGQKGINQIVCWGADADNETFLASLYYAWAITDPALEVGATSSSAFLIREAVQLSWIFGTLKGVIGTPIPFAEFIADTVTVVAKLSAQTFIEALTGEALILESPADNTIAFVGMPDLGNVAAYGFRRTGGTSLSANLAVQLGD